MAGDTLDVLLAEQPCWVTDVQRDGACAYMVANPPAKNGLAFGLIKLRLVATAYSNVKAYERPDGNPRLPVRCPERHINADHSFCLRYPIRVVHDSTSAKLWWRDLQLFLLLQAVATETGLWPATYALSHGSAADFELEARDAARLLGVEREYEALIDGEQNWLASAIQGGVSDAANEELEALSSDLEINARREAYNALMIAEHKRLAALEDYWAWERLHGTAICCKTMRECRLPDASTRSFGESID